MKRVATALVGLAVAFACLAVASGPAQALNSRVSISEFQWSDQTPRIDLGETITWDWIGPDTMHSVSGQPDNASQWDSDPGAVGPHPLGDTFSVTFSEPGEYTFVCKLHASVRGTVIVSNVQGDPFSNPGPQAPLNFDITPPSFQGVYMLNSVLGHKGKGTSLRFSVDERGTGSADFYKKVKKYKRNKKGKKVVKKVVRKFAGFQNWENHVGNNAVKFAQRTGEFSAKPGKYVALVTATDEAVNTTPATTLKFEIKSKNKKNKK
ncbi:MAG: plastocyanin/azurin family copper-binding protein [Solirubrobacterales bacterium]